MEEKKREQQFSNMDYDGAELVDWQIELDD